MNEIIRQAVEKCTGCDVCRLPCPVWRQTHDPSLTFSGRIKALQGGASPVDLYESLMACVLCGSCGPSCPEDIDTVETTLRLRAVLSDSGRPPFPAQAFSFGHFIDGMDYGLKEYGERTFIPCDSILENNLIMKKIERVLGLEGTISTGGREWVSISSGMQAGIYPSHDLKMKTGKALRKTRELVVSDCILMQNLRAWLPDVRILGLGEALIRLPVIRGALRNSDLYIIDSLAFHASYARLVSLYDQVRVETGCRMNLDLQRIAIPTGSSCLQEQYGINQIDPVEQARWIIHAIEFERIVVESLDDLAVFGKITDAPVIHVSELVQ